MNNKIKKYFIFQTSYNKSWYTWESKQQARIHISIPTQEFIQEFNHFDIYILDSNNCSSSENIILIKLTF